MVRKLILLILIVAVLAGVGWMFGAEYADGYNKDMTDEQAKLEREKNEKSKRVPDRDKLKNECNKLNSEINRLQRLSGANYLQWSTTMDSIKDVVPKEKVWITNLRIDSDRRVQLTAYSSNKENKDKPGQLKDAAGGENLTEGIREFIQGKKTVNEEGKVVKVGGLLNNPFFSDVFLTGATKNVYEKKPVWRFELNCRLLRELASKSEN